MFYALRKDLDESLPCVRDFDSYSYSREYEGEFMIGFFEPEAKPAVFDSSVPKDWKKHLKQDWNHLGDRFFF